MRLIIRIYFRDQQAARTIFRSGGTRGGFCYRSFNNFYKVYKAGKPIYGQLFQGNDQVFFVDGKVKAAYAYFHYFQEFR